MENGTLANLRIITIHAIHNPTNGKNSQDGYWLNESNESNPYIENHQNDENMFASSQMYKPKQSRRLVIEGGERIVDFDNISSKFHKTGH